MNGSPHIYDPGSKRFLTRPWTKLPRQLLADLPDMLDEPSLSPHRIGPTPLLVFVLCLLPACSFAYNVEDYEESGGMSFSVHALTALSPRDHPLLETVNPPSLPHDHTN